MSDDDSGTIHERGDRVRGRGWVFWVVAVLITLASATWQRLSGPTHPVRGSITLGEERFGLRLPRTHGGAGDLNVRVRLVDRDVSGEVAWRRFPTQEPWATIPLVREGDDLSAALPHQPPAGKIEYQVRLHKGSASATFPPRPAVARFKGGVPIWVLLPHVLAMFGAMLFSNRAGLEALRRGGDPRRAAWIGFVILLFGGFILGPIVQKLAFGAYWTGLPYGHDLTDNKTLIAAVAWAWAVFRMRGGRSGRGAIVFAAIVTLVIFAIPHSTWGSQLKWEDAGAIAR